MLEKPESPAASSDSGSQTKTVQPNSDTSDVKDSKGDIPEEKEEVQIEAAQPPQELVVNGDVKAVESFEEEVVSGVVYIRSSSQVTGCGESHDPVKVAGVEQSQSRPEATVAAVKSDAGVKNDTNGQVDELVTKDEKIEVVAVNSESHSSVAETTSTTSSSTTATTATTATLTTTTSTSKTTKRRKKTSAGTRNRVGIKKEVQTIQSIEEKMKGVVE